MRFLVVVLILGMVNCASTHTITPTATHMLHCPAIEQQRKALQKLMKFEEIRKEVRSMFYDKCSNPVSLYKRYCMRWESQMVLLELRYFHLQLEYERASRCSIEEFTTLRKIRK